MHELLHNYIKDTENPYNNFYLAKWYEDNGYTAPGLTFYLRAAERFEDPILAYNALLRGFFCYDKQGSRDDSAKILLQNAITLLPKRPEAYFLLCRFFEQRKYWQECYIYATLGLASCNFDNIPLSIPIDYPGKYSLLFYKSISGYWWGKSDECRRLFQDLVDNYSMDEPYKSIIVDHIIRLGSGPAKAVFRQYRKEYHDQLKFKFLSSDSIEHNFSQVYQDMFVLYMTRGKSDGTYLEIGSGDPFWLNNTYLLESKYNWKGIGIDYNSDAVNAYKNARKNTILLADAHLINYNELLNNNYSTNIIDYLQLDCEPAESTYNLLQKIPFDKYKFRVITYEHDYYVDMQRKYRDLSRQFLIDQGYQLVISNVACTDWSAFEDWWIHPDLVDEDLVSSIQNNNNLVKKIDDYFLDKQSFSELEVNNKKSITNFGNRSKRTAIIVDNFYDDPDAVRGFALSEEFINGGFGKGYIGKRTAHQYLFDGLKEKFEAILGQKITSWYEQPMNGRFQITYAGEPPVYHCDMQKWAGMIYLTPNAPFECGTTLYAHKITKARSCHDDGWDYSWKDQNLGDLHLDGTFFEPVDVLGNVYNRLVIFDGSNIHAASKYFGQIDTNSRLWHMFFFD